MTTNNGSKIIDGPLGSVTKYPGRVNTPSPQPQPTPAPTPAPRPQQPCSHIDFGHRGPCSPMHNRGMFGHRNFIRQERRVFAEERFLMREAMFEEMARERGMRGFFRRMNPGFYNNGYMQGCNPYREERSGGSNFWTNALCAIGGAIGGNYLAGLFGDDKKTDKNTKTQESSSNQSDSQDAAMKERQDAADFLKTSDDSTDKTQVSKAQSTLSSGLHVVKQDEKVSGEDLPKFIDALKASKEKFESNVKPLLDSKDYKGAANISKDYTRTLQLTVDKLPDGSKEKSQWLLELDKAQQLEMETSIKSKREEKSV